MQIAIADIQIGKRLRTLRPNVADAIAASFKTEGQFAPIIVRMGGPKPVLVAGAHRVSAAQICGWTHIEAHPIKLSHLDPEETDDACLLVELDENLMRGDLDQAERVVHVETRLDILNRRERRRKLREEKAALAKANRERAKAAAALKAAEESEKAARKAELDQAERVRVLAEQRKADAESRCRPIVISNDKQPTSTRMAPNVSAQMAKEAGLKATVIRNAHSFASILGMDVLEIITGTKMATQAEMQALVVLKKKDLKAFNRCIASAVHSKKYKTGSVIIPSGLLGEIIKAEKKAALEEAWKTDAGRLSELLKLALQAQNIFEDMRKFWYPLSPNIKAKSKAVETLMPTVNALATVFRAAAKPIEQKLTGTEHRYADELPKESKDDVRKSLGKDAKTIKAKLAKAKKKLA